MTSESLLQERDPDRAPADLARQTRIDPRIPATVPGFDAPFFQAGLAGYSDGAMRLVARAEGCPYCVTEALLDVTLLNGGKGRAREDPDLLAQRCCGEGTADPLSFDDHPIAGQIIGTHPDEMAAAAVLTAELGHDVVDVNLACPVKKIRKRSRGGHFLLAPDAAIDVLRAVRDAVPPEVPTTVKLRRAFDETPAAARAFERIFEATYELGYAWATVHGRTVAQKYVGPSRWEALAELVRRYPDRIIFGSGDIWRAEDIFRMLHLTGVHAVSVARGCIGDPWIFRRARRLMAGLPPTEPSLAEQRAVLLRHLELSIALHGERAAGRMMRKFGIKFSGHHPRASEVKQQFINCSTLAEWRAVLDAMYLEPALT